jgi:hypothetical protein
MVSLWILLLVNAVLVVPIVSTALMQPIAHSVLTILQWLLEAGFAAYSVGPIVWIVTQLRAAEVAMKDSLKMILHIFARHAPEIALYVRMPPLVSFVMKVSKLPTALALSAALVRDALLIPLFNMMNVILVLIALVVRLWLLPVVKMLIPSVLHALTDSSTIMELVNNANVVLPAKPL